jgi:hypothetical protein
LQQVLQPSTFQRSTTALDLAIESIGNPLGPQGKKDLCMMVHTTVNIPRSLPNIELGCDSGRLYKSGVRSRQVEIMFQKIFLYTSCQLSLR